MRRRVRTLRFALDRGDRLCLLVIVLLSTAFLAQALRPGYTLLPLGVESWIAPWHKQVSQLAKNILLSDPFYTFYPRRHFFTTMLRSGTFPLWNPYVFSGHPVLGDTAAQTFYPPNIVAALFLPAARALPILAWFHLTLTGISMFGFLRLLRVRPGPALLGAVAWMLNGSTVVWLENPHRLSTLAWMPAIFLLYELGLRRERTWPAVAGGFLYGLSILGGHTQLALGLGMSLAAYALFKTVVLSRAAGTLVWRPLPAVVLVGAMGVGIGAIQLLPTLELAGLSHRSVMTGQHFLATGWPLQHLIGLWIPDFYGNPVRFPYWGIVNYAEVTAYYGAITFPISLCALVWTRRAEGRFLALLMLVVLFTVLRTPVAWLVAWLPWARYFRLISLVAYMPFFGGAAAAFGVEAAVDLARRRRVPSALLLVVLAGLAGATALLALPNRESIVARIADIGPQLWRTGLIWLVGTACLLLARSKRAPATALLVALVAIDLLQWGLPFNPVNSLDILYPENDVTAWLRQDGSLYRILPLQTEQVVFGPNVLSVFGMYETGGYSSLSVQRYRELVKSIDDQVGVWWMRPNRNMLVNGRFKPLFSMLNVKYVLDSEQLDQPLVSVEATHSGCGAPYLPLTSGVRVTGTFQAHNPGLNRVDVEFSRTDESPAAAASVRFRLWRDREGGDLVADITVDGEDVPERGVHVFWFAPVADSAGQTFLWQIETPDASEASTVAICRAAGEPDDRPAFAAYSVQLQLADIQQGVWIYENPNVLPRAYAVHRVEVAAGENLLGRMSSPDFNPWTTALLEEPLPAEQAASLAAAPLRSPSAARIERYEPHRVEVVAEMQDPGLLVLSDTYYPGWEVTVDGSDAVLLRTNYALRGVYLPAGVHQVVFRFVPTVFRTGLIVAAAVFASGSAVALWDIRRELRENRSAASPIEDTAGRRR
jgi:hypothetical protein